MADKDTATETEEEEKLNHKGADGSHSTELGGDISDLLDD